MLAQESAFTVPANFSRRMSLHINAEARMRQLLDGEVVQSRSPPGDISLLKVLLDASRLKKVAAEKKQVLVRTDDPRSPKVILYLYGKAT